MKIFITGTSKGLGAALALKLAAKGHTVFSISRSGERPSDWLPDFKGKFWQGDASSKETVSDIASELRHINNLPDILIFNAASMDEDIVGGKFNSEISEQILRVNFLGPLFWIEEFLPDFLASKSGMFVAISSLVAYRPLSKGLHNAGYVASKSALSSAFDFFRLRYMDTGVKFLTFHFGRMGRPIRGVPCVSYEKAADFLCRRLENPMKKQVFDYPFLSAIVYRFSRFMPDRFWSNFIRET